MWVCGSSDSHRSRSNACHHQTRQSGGSLLRFLLSQRSKVQRRRHFLVVDRRRPANSRTVIREPRIVISRHRRPGKTRRTGRLVKTHSDEVIGFLLPPSSTARGILRDSRLNDTDDIQRNVTFPVAKQTARPVSRENARMRAKCARCSSFVTRQR